MEESKKTIFVAIASYNEPDLEQTIRSCIENAKYPNRLRFGVWSHNSDGVIPSFSDIPYLKMITAQFPTQLGVCPSRTGALFLYNDEDYYLQVDAHMLFQKDWDEVVITHYLNINQNYEKPIITTYVPWWAKDHNGNILFYSPTLRSPSMPMCYMDDGESEIPMQGTFVIDWNDYEYYEHHGLSAHFVFTSGSFVRDILPDIDIMFYGEEPTTAMRAWTRGYRIFVVEDPIVWHYNKGYDGQLYEFDRHRHHGDPFLFRDHYKTKEHKAHKKVRDILLGNITGYWGAPDKESLMAFHQASGFDFFGFYEKNENRLTK